MAVKKASVKDLAEKAAAATKKEAAKAEPAKKEVAKKAEPAKKETAKKAEPAKKAAPAKKAPAKKAAAPKVEVKVEFQGGSVSVEDLKAKAVEIVGKNVKELNLYYQPEYNKVYYTADDQKGEFDA